MIHNHKLEAFEKDTKTPINKERKELFGEINTPFPLIKQIFSVIPDSAFQNPSFKWLDPGTGSGNFSIFLYFKLLNGLKEKISNITERKDHIIKNMIYMVEIQPDNILRLKNLFGPNANIHFGDFLDYMPPEKEKFDYIIGNPPFNINGLKKVPTNTNTHKKQDGYTIWPLFIKKSISLLTPETGKLCVIIPSIWLKPDKEKMYQYLTKYKIEYLNCFSNTEANKIFKGNAQTPCCYFLLTKQSTNNIITIFDKTANKYIDYQLKPASPNNSNPIPVFAQEAISILSKFLTKPNQHIEVIKTNMPPKSTFLSSTKTETTPYPNISSCIFENNTNRQQSDLQKTSKLIINYSNKPLAFYNQPKLVLAHKMYGLPYLDETGEYGISNRDNYVILPMGRPRTPPLCAGIAPTASGIAGLIKLQQFLSSKTVQYLFKSTTYRMKYLEKYVFELLPDIRKIPDFPTEITDETTSQYFGLNI